MTTLGLDEIGDWAAALLRGETLGRAVVLPAARTERHAINLAGAWERAGDAWRRSFGRPTGVEAGAAVRLVFTAPAHASVTLNGVALPALRGDTPSWSHDVTTLLGERNELVLSAEALPGADMGAVGRVSLPNELGRPALEIVSHVVDP